jgi:hypothetical protein
MFSKHTITTNTPGFSSNNSLHSIFVKVHVTRRKSQQNNIIQEIYDTGTMAFPHNDDSNNTGAGTVTSNAMSSSNGILNKNDNNFFSSNRSDNQVDNDNGSDDDVVHHVIQSIVSHYNKNEAGNEYDDVPYFDPLLGKPFNLTSHDDNVNYNCDGDGDSCSDQGGPSNATNSINAAHKATKATKKSSTTVNHCLEALLIHCQKKKKIESMVITEDVNENEEIYTHDSRNHDQNHNGHNNNEHNIVARQSIIQVGTNLIEAYQLHVRSECFTFHQASTSTTATKVQIEDTAHLILIHYEMIINGYIIKSKESLLNANLNPNVDANKSVDTNELNDANHNNSTRSSSPSMSMNMQISLNSVYVSKSTSTVVSNSIQIIHKIIKGIVQDILYLTCIERIKVREKNKKIGAGRHKKELILNWILPTLLRIIDHAICFLHDIVLHHHLLSPTFSSSSSSSSSSNNFTCTSLKKNDIQRIQSCLSYGIIAASSFCPNSDIDPTAVTTNTANSYHTSDSSSNLSIFETLCEQKWKEQFSLQHLMDTCAYSPDELSSLQPSPTMSSSSSSSSLSLSSSNVNKSQINKTIDNDDGNNNNDNNGQNNTHNNDYFDDLLYHVKFKTQENDDRLASASNSTLTSTTAATTTTATSTATTTEIISKTLNESIINFDDSPSSTRLKIRWLDHIKGIGHRSARSLLQRLDLLAMNVLQIETMEGRYQRDEDDNIHNHDHKSHNNDTNIQRERFARPNAASTIYGRILNVIDMEEFIKVIRANFFGRLDHPFQFDKSRNCKRIEKGDEHDNFIQKLNGNMDVLAFNGITPTSHTAGKPIDEIHEIRAINQLLTKQNDNKSNRLQKSLYVKEKGITLCEDQPFNQVKARIVSSIRLLSSLRFPLVSSLVWSNSLPIIYTLIDSNDSSHQSLGGALFLHFLDECTPTSFLHSDSYPDSVQGKRMNVNYSMTNFDTALQVLSLAIRSCDDAVSLSILSKVRCRLFEIAGESAIPRIGSLRRDAAAEIISWVNKRIYCGPNGEAKLVSALTASLVSGVHCSLVQIANQPNADAAEIARLGLSTLLPLIRWDASSLVGRRVQFTAISCLISLMMGAYPIMEKHGGKIMAELLSCIGRGLRDLRIQENLRLKIHGGKRNNNVDITNETEVTTLRLLIAFAIHAASVAHIICGTRADEVLLQLKRGNYSPELITCCKFVTSGSTKMLKSGRKKESCNT